MRTLARASTVKAIHLGQAATRVRGNELYDVLSKPF